MNVLSNLALNIEIILRWKWQGNEVLAYLGTRRFNFKIAYCMKLSGLLLL